jgi:hypothetical protein
MRKPNWGRRPKPVSPARALERRIASLPPMPESEREESIRQLCQEFGIEYETLRRSYGP